MKQAAKAISIILVFAIILGITPIDQIASPLSSAMAQESKGSPYMPQPLDAGLSSGKTGEIDPRGYSFEIPQYEETWLEPEMPPTFVFDETYSEYLYVPRAERTEHGSSPDTEGSLAQTLGFTVPTFGEYFDSLTAEEKATLKAHNDMLGGGSELC